jgi:acetyl esterase
VINKLLDHVKALAGRPLLRALVETPFLRARLARSRSAPVDGQVVDEALAVMLALDDVTHDSDYRGRTPVQARADMRRSLPLVEAPEPTGVSTRDEVLPGGIASRLYVPVGLAAPSPGMVYLHGGGWVTGDLETHDRFCRRLAAHGKIRVVAVDYRLAPEHRYPAGVDDALAAFRHVAHEAAHFGIADAADD